MKANELMIGDWVYVSKNFTQKYHKIRALSNDEDAVLRGIYVNEYGIESNSVFKENLEVKEVEEDKAQKGEEI